MSAPCIVTQVFATRVAKTVVDSFVTIQIDRHTFASIDEVVYDILQMLYANIVYVGGTGVIHFIYDPHIGMAFDTRAYHYRQLEPALERQILKNINRLEDVRYIIDGNVGRPLALRVQLSITVSDGI